MENNKKIYIVLILFIVLVGSIYFFKSNNKILALSTDKVSIIKIVNGNNGESIKVDNKDDINKIIDNLKSIEFKKDKKLDSDGFTFSMSFYDNEMNKLDSATINSTNTIIYKGYFYINKTNSIDYDFINSLFSKYEVTQL